MFLKAGALSLALLLASRLLGLARESAQAAAFGASGLGDVAVLMLTLPDWLAGLLASGAFAYVLVPAWAGQDRAHVAAMQRRLTRVVLAAAALFALALVAMREPAARWLAGGLGPDLQPAAANALVWSAVALPGALLAALWATRLQHERDFTGMYAANLVVNVVLIAAILVAGSAWFSVAIVPLGIGLLLAMALRLAWLSARTPRNAAHDARYGPIPPALPAPPVWLWAALSAGLPLALPFVARSLASHSGEGALATFNYAWKLIELPLVLAIQLVAALAFPIVARSLAGTDRDRTAAALRSAFALAWALACAAAAVLIAGAPAIAGLLFGWGRMDGQALARVAQWGAVGAWSLLPQALIAVALTVLATERRMGVAVWAYAAALGVLLLVGAWMRPDGAMLMWILDAMFVAVAAAALAALGPRLKEWLPLRSMAVSLAGLVAVVAVVTKFPAGSAGLVPGLAVAGVAGLGVMAAAWWGSVELRTALAR
jgi:peptidoglycan biosynthesis protein MviN/MurJ (putative lipid II flippase)